MGQPITVETRPGVEPGVRIYSLNRSLSGMAIERYSTVEETEAKGDRPPDVLARRLIEVGATSVTVYSNVVTVSAPPERWGDLGPEVEKLIGHLFESYGEDAGWSPEALGDAAQPSSPVP